MRPLRSTGLLALTAGFAAACAPDAVTGSPRARAAAVPNAPGFEFNVAAPVPQIASATVVGRLDNSNSIVRITFTDNATDEWMTSAYITPDASFNSPVTLTISGTPSAGERSVDIYAPTGYTTVRMQNVWKSSSALSGLVWSPFSESATITAATSTTTKVKGRSK